MLRNTIRYLTGLMFFFVCLFSSTFLLHSESLKINIYRISVLILLTLCIINKKFFIDWSRLYSSLLILMLYLFSFLFFGASPGGSVFAVTVIYILIFVKAEELLFWGLIAVKLLAVLFFIGLIFYILYLIDVVSYTGIYETSNQLKVERGVFFKNIYGVLNITSSNRGDLLRYQSVFDEPGVVGTISGLAIIAIHKTRLTKEKIVFYLAGVASLSGAFFAFVIINILINFSFRIVAVLLISSLILFFTVVAVTPGHILDLMLIAIKIKFEIGDNRVSQCFWSQYDKAMEDNYWVGMGQNATINLGCDISSFFAQIYDYGYLGISVISFMVFLIYCSIWLNINKREVITVRLFIYLFIWLLILILNFYQRPSYLYPLWIVFGAMFLLTNSSIKKRVYEPAMANQQT